MLYRAYKICPIVYTPVRVVIMGIVKSHAPVRTPCSRNTKSEYLAHYGIASTRHSRIEVPRVDYEKLNGDRVRESSEAIRARVLAARDIQTKRYSSIRNSNTELSTIVCNADMRVGEIMCNITMNL